MGSGQSRSKKSQSWSQEGNLTPGGLNNSHLSQSKFQPVLSDLSLSAFSLDYGAPPVYSSNNPTAPGYSQPGYPPVGGGGGGGYEAPPAYSAVPNNSLVSGSSQPQVQQYSAQYMAQNYGAFPPLAPVGPVHGQFDAGARFSARSPPSIPPPPPGVAPTPAQLAAMQGQQVVMGQKEGGVMSGSGSGGYTFW